MTGTYNWQRYWAPDDTALYLDAEAYLPDPAAKYSLNPQISDLAKLQDRPCTVLLGESGLGKTHALKDDFKRLGAGWTGLDCGALIDLGTVASQSDLRFKIHDNSVVRDWRTAGRGTMHLYLDSLDESLPLYPSLPKALMEALEELGDDRLRLSLACRTGEFPTYLESRLI